MQHPRLKASTLALSAALATFAPTFVFALDCSSGPVSTGIAGPVTWSSADCTITGSATITSVGDGALNTMTATAGTLTNGGVLTSNVYGLQNTGTIGVINSNGKFIGTSGGAGILNASAGVIAVINNQLNGTITGDYAGVRNFGQIGILNNLAGGTVSGNTFGFISEGGTIQAINNSGVFTGPGTVILNNGGAIVALTNSGAINGAAGVTNNAFLGTLTNDASGRITATDTGVSNSGTIGVISNSGTILTGGKSVTNATGGVIGSLTNSQLISSTGNIGVSNGGVITTLANSGTIVSANAGVNNTSGSIGTLTNSGAITSVGVGILNSLGTITRLTNTGAIVSSNDYAINNLPGGTIGTLTNSGTLSGVGFASVNNEAGVIGALNNSGTITATNTGISNTGTISSLINGGSVLSATSNAIYNNGTIGVISNAAGGTISSASTDPAVITLFNLVTITALNNAGLITGLTAVRSQGAIGTLTNSGTITGSVYAFYNAGSGTIGGITNSGVIAGEIRNTSVRDLVISGGTGSTFGTLTGFGGGIGLGNVGVITNLNANVLFASGNLLLNDHVNVTGHGVINSGAILQVNNPVTITGNYTQNAAATLNVGVGSGVISTGVISADSNYGRLTVSGVATFDANSAVALTKTGTYNFAQGQRYVAVQATTANAIYNAALLKYSAIGYAGAVTGAAVVDSDNATKTDLVLTVGALTPVPDPTPIPTPTPTPTPAPAPINNASDPNAAAALTALFRYTGTNAGMLNLFNAAAAIGGTTDVDRVAAQLNPAATGAALVQSAGAAGQAVATIAAAHVDAVRVAQAGNGGVAAGDSPRDIAMWGQAFGGQAKQSDRAEAAGYTAGYNGLLIGADTAVNDLWRAGALVSYANTSIASSGNNAGSSGHVNAYGVTGYAGYTADTWYLNLSAGVARQKYDTLRTVNFTGFSGAAFGQFNGTQYITSVEAGYPIRLDAATTLTPIAGLTYSKLNQDAYTETGSAVALHMASASTSSVKSDLGAKLDRSWQTAYGDLTPSAQLGWRHEYRNTSVQAVSNFAADTTGSTSFTTQGPTAARDTGVLVLGATLARTSNLTLAAHYTVEAASGFTAQTADLRLRYQF